MNYGNVFVILLITALFIGCVPQSASPPKEVRKQVEAHYKLGIKYLGEGRTPEAVSELLAAQALVPNNPDIEHALGLAYQQKGLYDRAIDQYKKSIELDPKLSDARNNLGTVYLVKAQFKEAIEQFEKCLEDKDYATPEKAHYNLAVAYFNQKEQDLDKAVFHYQQAAKLGRDNVNAIFGLGFCYEKKKDYLKALEQYTTAIRINAKFKEAHYRIGMVRKAQGQLDKAMISFQEALKIDRDFLEALLEVGIIETLTGKTEEGLKKLDLIQKADPEGLLGKKAKERITEMKKDKFKGIPKVEMGKKKKKK